MNASDFLAFLRRHRLAVVSTARDGAPQAAIVGIAVTDGFEIVFDTVTGTRKYANLIADPRVALVAGWDYGQTVQIEGFADVPSGRALEACKQAYFAVWPDGRRARAMARHRLCPHPPALAALQRLQQGAAADRGTDAALSSASPFTPQK